MGAVVGFFFSPLGRVIAIVAVLAAWTIYQRDQAADRAREECQAEQLQKTLDEVRRQLDAAQRVVADAEKQQAVTDREMAELEKERDSILEQLNAKPDPEKPDAKSCRRVPDDLRKRLRNIR